MFDEHEYKAAFSKVTASRETRQEVMQMTERSKPRTPSGGRKLAVLIAAVIALMAVTVTAFAAEEIAGWFREYFDQKSEKELTTSQKDLIDGNSIDIQQSQTHDGYTVTLDSVFADKYLALFKLKIQCPEGIQFCDSPWGTAPAKIELIKADEESLLGGCSMKKMDDDISDNTGYILCTFDVSPYETEQRLIQNETKYTLQITNLWNIYALEDGTVRWDVVANGVWEFDVEFEDISLDEIEFIDEPLTVTMPVDGLIYPESVTVSITSLKMTAMTISIQYTFASEDFVNPCFLPCSVVLKDGSMIELEESAVLPMYTELRSDVPIALLEVDYILLSDSMVLFAHETE